jgi:hypothetical protein
VKTSVDDRNKTPKKLTPELYGAAIDEAHKYNLRTIAHVYDLERRTASLCVYSNRLRTLSI